MRILQVSTRDIGGGAERVAWNLFQQYRLRGHAAWLAVGEKKGDDPDVLPLIHAKGIWTRFWQQLSRRLAVRQWRGAWRLSRLAQDIAEPRSTLHRQRGYEHFDYPATQKLLRLPPQPPDLLHCHNLHGGYFDLRWLPKFSRRLPVVFTLHDAWLLSGHCGHSFDCERWKTGCGACPDLSIYPPLRRDGTAYNWRRKRTIYEHSRLYISTPSQWLMNKVEQSILMRGTLETKVIPYGVDLNIFTPTEKSAARAALGLPQEAFILLFSAASIRQNIFKDYATMREAVHIVAQKTPAGRVIFLALGEDAPREPLSDHVEICFMPYQRDLAAIARFYQAADLYLHAARADTFPNAVLEALACGIPVVASAVGGIPEQVKSLHKFTPDQASGVLTSVGDAVGMAEAVLHLLAEADLCAKLGRNAAQDAHQRFDLMDQVQTHLAWYSHILETYDTR